MAKSTLFPFTKRGAASLLLEASGLTPRARDAAMVASHLIGAKRGRFLVPRDTNNIARYFLDMCARVGLDSAAIHGVTYAGSTYDTETQVAFTLPRGYTAAEAYAELVRVVENEAAFVADPLGWNGLPIALIKFKEPKAAPDDAYNYSIRLPRSSGRQGSQLEYNEIRVLQSSRR